MARTYHIAAPAELVWPVVSVPSSWPWLGADPELTVRLVRASGAVTEYRAAADGEETAFRVDLGVRSAELRRTGGGTGDPALSWSVRSLPGGGCELTWTASDALPGPLRRVWGEPSFAGTLEEWAGGAARAAASSDPVDAAVALAPLLRGQAPYSDAAATTCMGSVAALRASGLFRLGLPKALGGLDADPCTIVDTIAELTRADPSTGWATFISANQAAYTAWLDDPTAAGVVVGDEGLIVAGSTAVNGRAEPDGDALVVDGRWRFNSGCLHADWLIAGVSVPAGETRVPAVVFVHPDDATIHGTWDVVALSGTGSHDVVLDGVRVPESRVAPLFTAPAGAGETLHRLSPYNIQAVFMVGFPLGLARRALDELLGSVDTDDDATAVEIAGLEIELAAAQALAHETVAGYWAELSDAEALSVPSQARLALVMRHAVDSAKRVTGAAMRLAGAFSSRNAALRRCHRDAFGTGQHLAAGDEIYERNAGRLLSGGPR